MPGISSSIAATNVSFAMGGTITTGSGGQKTATKIKIGEIKVTKPVDNSSSKLILASDTGKHFNQVVIDFTKTGSTQPYMEFQLENVLISSIQLSTPPQQNLPQETVTFNFNNILFEYSQNPSNPLAGILPLSSAISDGPFLLRYNINLDNLDTFFHNSDVVANVSATGSGVPEPASLMLLVSGLVGLALGRRRA